MCDIPDLTAKSPLTVDGLLEHIKLSCEKGRAMLKETWLVECATIVGDLKEDIENMMPVDEVRLLSFMLDTKNVKIWSCADRSFAFCMLDYLDVY